MAVDEINAKGGIAGQKLEFDMRYSTTKPEEAVKNVRYHVDSWGADFTAGIDSSGQCLSIAPLMQQLDKIFMVTHGATEKLTEEWVYKKGVKQIFRNCMPVYNDGNAAAFVAKERARSGTKDEQVPDEAREQALRKFKAEAAPLPPTDRSLKVAYALWFLTGLAGGHRFYLRRPITGALQASIFASCVGAALLQYYWAFAGLSVSWLWFLVDGIRIKQLHLWSGKPA